MVYLIAVSCLWAFSFGLIGSRLVGLDSTIVAAFRLGLACLCFLPFLRFKGIGGVDRWRLIGVGALQFGVMYVFYIRAFSFLPSYLVALFSVLTPLYVVLVDSVFEKSFRWQIIGCAVLSVAGAAVIRFAQPESSIWAGFFLMQIANVAFGAGQVFYRRWKIGKADLRDSSVFALMYLGGFLFAAVAVLVLGDFSKFSPSNEQWLVLFYLGIIASGVGFFLWNKGATKVSAGTLAAFNNAVIPLGIIASLFVFGEIDEITRESVVKLLIGGWLILGAIVWSRRGLK